MNNNTPDVTRVTLKNNDRTNINNILTTINYDITDCEAKRLRLLLLKSKRKE